MCHSHENHIYIHTEARHGARGFGIRGSSAQLCNTSGAVCHLQPIAGYDVRSPKSQAAHIEFIEERAALGRNPQDGSAAANVQGSPLQYTVGYLYPEPGEHPVQDTSILYLSD